MEDRAENQSPSSILHSPSSRSRPLWPAYAAESFSSVSTTLLSVGIFFYTEHYFHWTLRQNLLLAAAQGTAYVIGSLSSHGLAERFGRRRALIALFAILAAIVLIALARWMVAMLIAFMFVSSMVWPILESLVSSDADAHAMSRRVGLYNLVWSGTNVITLAVAGTIIERGPAGLFVIPAIAFVISGLFIAFSPSIDQSAPGARAPHAEPEP
jgi:MFS family permease